MVNAGQTAYERGNDRFYTGKVAMFGEDVLGYLRVDNGVFLSRSIRRNAIPFNLHRLGELENYPWEFGLAALGNGFVHSKRETHALQPNAALHQQVTHHQLHMDKNDLQIPDFLCWHLRFWLMTLRQVSTHPKLQSFLMKPKKTFESVGQHRDQHRPSLVRT